MSDNAILREIGDRLKSKRLSRNLSQQRLAENSGLNRTTVRDIEKGNNSSLLTLIQLLRGLHSPEEFDSFLPEPGVSPLQLAKMKGKQRRRASPLRTRKES
jgi:transcriptional regulator with XRE-family HTH domain